MATNLQALKDAAEGKAPALSETDKFRRVLDQYKSSFAQVLPAHLNADRMTRLAVSAFARSKSLQQADPRSLVSAIMTASTLGLEIDVLGQGYLVPYNDRRNNRVLAQFIPGWKGLVDLVSRAGRATVWTGAVFQGDQFDYALGDSPFVRHRPGDEDDSSKLTHVYAIGRVNGSQYPVIEVWTIEKIRRHRDKFNKVGGNHYSYEHWEMYARKIPLLQVLKYMPSSVELSNAITLDAAHESGKHATLDGQFVSIEEDGDDKGEAPQKPEPEKPTVSARSKPAAVAPAQEREAPKPVDRPPQEKPQANPAAARPPLFDEFTGLLARIAKTADTDTAYLMLDEARTLMGEMSEADGKRAVLLFDACVDDLKARAAN